MSKTKIEHYKEDQGKREQQYHEKEKHTLVDALCNATRVSRNSSFDHNNGENHPFGSTLRSNLKQRWNNLILATASSPSPTVHQKNRGQIADEKLNDNDHLPASEISYSWFQKIYDRHIEAGRHYHTAVHLWEMFELLDLVIDCLSSPEWYVPMAWSVFFHDSIYDPKSGRNEKDSAELFRGFVDECMAKSMNDDTFDIAMTMILATEKHKVIIPSKSKATSTSKEHEEEKISMQEYFLDIDMAVLGKQSDAYFKYAALIRKEYEFVPHNVYCSKRAEILETFLVGNDSVASSSIDTSTKKNVYLTETFRGAFENQARENLRDEIQLLRKNTIPE